jgi:hypothetical protein
MYGFFFQSEGTPFSLRIGRPSDDQARVLFIW